MMDEHCSVETLLDLTLGDLPKDEAFEVREHLIACDSCRARMQELLDESDAPPAGDAQLDDKEVDKAWRRFSDTQDLKPPAGPTSTRRVTEPRESRTVPSSSDHRTSHRRPKDRGFKGAGSLALAAGLALAAVGLWNLVGPATQKPGVHEAAPKLASGASTFAEKGSPTRSSRPDRPTPVSCACRDQLMIWRIEIPRLLELETPAVSKVELWHGDQIVAVLDSASAENGLLRLIVPPALTPNGAYVVKVFVPGDEVSEDFYFDVQCGD